MINKLKKHLKEIGNMHSALEIIYWDMQTKMPKKAIEQRSGMIEHMSGEIFKMKTSNELGEILDNLSDKIDSFNEIDKAIIKTAKKEYDNNKKIPEDRYRAFVVCAALSEHAWGEAKEANDFSIFKPHLEKIINFKKEFVEYLGHENNKYDTLLDEYEEGLTVEILDKVFGELRDGIIDILGKIQKSDKKINRNFLVGNFKKESQERFAKFILEKMGYDFNAGRLDESMHPFTIGFGNKDVRITTNYDNPEFTNALFSSIHEGGHGIYDQDIRDEFMGTGLDTNLSMSIHESQSRFYENLIGRSREFWAYFFPFAKYEFEEFRGISFEEFYEAINYVEPSLIRTEADELTYSIHIIIRYEVEKALINGEVDIDGIKDLWNKKYKEYLGVDVPNDSMGILQDVHWSDGSFGYFPSYALGNLYGAQMLNTMKKNYVGVYDDIRHGELGGIHMWLSNNVHKHASIYKPSELIEIISGEKLTAKYFLDYLQDKYSKIYEF